MPDKASPRSRTRISNACQRCRRKKIKCSGVQPCHGCTERSVRCIFEEAGRKVLISERYLRRLQGAAQREGRSPSPADVAEPGAITNDETILQPTAAAANILTPIEEVVPSVQNPLTSSESFFLVDSSGKQRYLGSSSSLSFSWQIRSLLKHALSDDVPINLVPQSEEATYTMASAHIRESLPLVVDDIPSREYAKYLVETTLFHLGELYHVFEKESFMLKLNLFYDEGECDQPLKTLWHVQFLLVIAFGKLFLRRGASVLGPPGATDFLKAVKLQQDVLDLWDDPILRIEVLVLITLYLNTADMRGTAYTFIGQAMRIALSLGMNRETPPGYLCRTEYERRRRLWWTLYIIDKKLCVIMGAPQSIKDEDIDISLPEENDLAVSNSALNIHIKLASLEGKVLSAAYRINGAVDKSFITGIQGVFSTMVKLAEDFQGDFSINLQRPSRISRVAATLHIMYYQCSIIATRPILFVLVKQRLKPLLNEEPVAKTVSEPVVALLNTCVEAASKILKILSLLHSQDLVEPFLPLHLQAVFSAGFILTLTSIAYPHVEIDHSCIAKAGEILDWMTSKGNAPAKTRRMELDELQAAANRINIICSQPSFNLRTPVHDPSWLWDALDIDGAAMNLNLASSIDLTFNDALMVGVPEEMRGHEWFWAGEHQ